MSDIDWLTARPIAHRGYHDRGARRIENTLPSAEAAIAHNFAIECDLQLTADGSVVVFHDGKLDRLTEGSGELTSRSLAELRALKVRDSDARIPTLDELLDLVDGRVPLVIELKSKWNGDRRLEQAVAPILLAYTGPACVMSFDPASMAAMRRLAPNIPRGLVADHFADGKDWGHLSPSRRFALRHLMAAPLVWPRFVSFGIRDLPADAPLLLRHFGLPLITWTIRTPEDWRKARQYTDQITFEGFDPDAGVPAA
jgi:glycerophosphoryl diester phosphodiesterase